MGREEGGRDGEKRSSMWMIEMKECDSRERKGGGERRKRLRSGIGKKMEGRSGREAGWEGL